MRLCLFLLALTALAVIITTVESKKHKSKKHKSKTSSKSLSLASKSEKSTLKLPFLGRHGSKPRESIIPSLPVDSTGKSDSRFIKSMKWAKSHGSKKSAKSIKSIKSAKSHYHSKKSHKSHKSRSHSIKSMKSAKPHHHSKKSHKSHKSKSHSIKSMKSAKSHHHSKKSHKSHKSRSHSIKSMKSAISHHHSKKSHKSHKSRSHSEKSSKSRRSSVESHSSDNSGGGSSGPEGPANLLSSTTSARTTTHVTTIVPGPSSTPGRPSEKPTTIVPGPPSEKPTTIVPGPPSKKPTTIVPGPPSEKPTIIVPGPPSKKPTTIVPGPPSEGPTTIVPEPPSTPGPPTDEPTIIVTIPPTTVVTRPPYQEPDKEGETEDDKYFAIRPEVTAPQKPKPLGIEGGVIGDSAITASSYEDNFEPSMARPTSGSGWVSEIRDTKPWIQVDLRKPMAIHGVGTIGHHSRECWVKTYLLQISINGVDFTNLLNKKTNKTRVFLGNSDQDTWRRHCLHLYYGYAPQARVVRFVPLSYRGCVALRFELYGYRDGNDTNLVKVLRRDAWTRTTSGCACYFDPSRSDCACCEDGGCQCPRSNLHQCVQCGYGSMCGIPEVRPPSVQVDQWTRSERGCPCHWDPSHQRACACCQRYGCQCGRENPNQCVQCGSPHHCGQKEDKFGPNRYCKPKVCPASELLP